MRYLSGGLVAFMLVPAAALSDPEVKGRVMVDNVFYDGAHNGGEEGSEWQIRRARIGIEHEIDEGWEAELEIDFNDDDDAIGIKDAYITYTGWGLADITVGKTKEPFGLENKTSSLDITTMERSIVTEVFSPGRNIGAQLSQEAQTHSWSLGVFQSSEDENGLDGYAMTGRATLSPVNRHGSVLHLGVSGSTRDLQGEGYEINEPMEVNAASKIVETPELMADRIESLSLEGALVLKQFSLQSEWMAQNITPFASAEIAGGDFNFDGYYVLASYFLTGESRIYDEGTFDSPDPNRPSGAWEVVARYSSIDLTDMDQGTSATSALVGINWYATKRTRVMLNMARIDVEGSDSDESGTGDSLSLRLQYKF